MATRRGFLTGLMATGLVPAATWADAGAPAFLSAARQSDGSFVLCGIGHDLDIRFCIPLPARGHAAAAHPTRPEAVAFARRPGTFAVVLDCALGQPIARLEAPLGRHFYGHGVFSADGRWLYTTESEFNAGQGRIGVWDSARGYQRVDEFSSGGIGPHDIRRLPDSETLIVANGGIETHPETGRSKLNIATMRPNLAYLDAGQVSEVASLPPDWHKNSIRHLAVSRRGTVAIGTQWQGQGSAPFLIGLHDRGTPIRPIPMTAEEADRMQGYIGSLAFTAKEQSLVATSPRGGVVQAIDTGKQALSGTLDLADVCGVARSGGGSLLTTGTGRLTELSDGARTRDWPDLAWDNHLVPLDQV